MNNLDEMKKSNIDESPSTHIDPDQAWFWTKRWQQMEREVDEDIADGRVTVHEDTASFFKYLDSL